MADEVLLTVNEAARRLGLSKRTVYDLANAGDLERRYVGSRNYRIPAQSVEDYAANLPTEPALP